MDFRRFYYTVVIYTLDFLFKSFPSYTFKGKVFTVHANASNQDMPLTNTYYCTQLYGRNKSQNCHPEDSIKSSIVTSFLKP